MAPDPRGDRLRLVIEPEDDATRVLSAEDGEPQRLGAEGLVELDGHPDEPEYEFEDEEETARHQGILPVGLAVIALLGFGAVSWYAYQGVLVDGTQEPIPLIQADAGPIKSRPTAPGGIEVPHQDKLVLNEISPDPEKPQVERLLPPPEVPKPPVPAQKPNGASGELAAKTAQSEPQSSVDAGTGTQGDTESTPLETAAGPAPSLAPAAGKQAPDGEAVTKPAPPAGAASNTEAQAAGAAAKAPAPQETQKAALTEGFLIQLASLKDKNLVGGEWLRLQKAFPDLLAGKKLVLQSADLGSRGVYHRVRAGYFGDQASATAACRAFKAKNQDCIVVRP